MTDDCGCGHPDRHRELKRTENLSGFGYYCRYCLKLVRREKMKPDEIPAHKRLYCSFCGHESTDVNFLVHGPNVNICDECVDDCVHLILERDQDAIIRSGYKHLLERIHEMEEQNMRQAITTHSYEPEEAKKMTEIEIVLERLSDMARDHYIRDPQSTRDAMADIQIIRNALKGHARTMLKVEIAPGIEVFMTANQKADWEKLK